MDCVDDFFMSVYLIECFLKMYVMRKEVRFQGIHPKVSGPKTVPYSL